MFVKKTMTRRKKLLNMIVYLLEGKYSFFYQNYIIKTGLTRKTRLNALRMQLERTNSKTQ